MALRDWLSGSGRIATANIAKVATVGALYPVKKRAVVVADQEKADIKPEPTVLQSDNIGLGNMGVRKDLSLASEVCMDCKRIEVIDFTGDTSKPFPGCLYPAVGTYSDGWKLLPDGLKECMWASVKFPAQMEGQLSIPNSHRREHGKLTTMARTWLHDHRQELRQNGWTAAELYRPNKSHSGIAWLEIWNKPGLTVGLVPGGVVQFGFPANGVTVYQTARPIAQKEKCPTNNQL